MWLELLPSHTSEPLLLLSLSWRCQHRAAILTVQLDNLNSIDSPQACRGLPVLLKRIKRLRERELDRVAYTILESLGRQTYLTDPEHKVLMDKKAGCCLSLKCRFWNFSGTKLCGQPHT